MAIDFRYAAPSNLTNPNTLQTGSYIASGDPWVFVDFDGHTSPSGTGFTTTNSNFTLAQRVEVMQALDAAFAPFKIRFTTNPTAVSGAGAYSGKLAIGASYTLNGGPANNTGGQGFLNGFGVSSSEAMAVAVGSNAIQVADTAVHEIGHTLGLNHKGIASNVALEPFIGPNGIEYYQGHSTPGGNYWATIMGGSANALSTPVGKYFPQWSKGSYRGASTGGSGQPASNTVDEIAAIGAKVGFRPDDHGDTITGASIRTKAIQNFTTGLINNQADVDVFRFSHGGGTIDLRIDPVSGVTQEGGGGALINDDRYSPLNIKVDLLNSAGAVVYSHDPTNSKGAVVSGSFGSGTYYLRVDGVGEGSFGTSGNSTGFDDYGSVGNYIVSGLG